MAWRLAQARYGTPGWVPQVIAATAVLAFVSLLTGYGIKLATAAAAVRTSDDEPGEQDHAAGARDPQRLGQGSTIH